MCEPFLKTFSCDLPLANRNYSQILRRASPKRKGLRGERPEGKPAASYGVKIFGFARLNVSFAGEPPRKIFELRSFETRGLYLAELILYTI